jgi:uncharacterized membrane protein YhaH (DUF805 family)
MLDRFTGFSGRIGRGTWWLGQFIVIPVVYFLAFGGLIAMFAVSDAAQDQSASMGMGAVILLLVAGVAAIWVNISTTIQRFHDRGKSGFWFMIVFVPFVGVLWQIIECGFCSGDDGDNEYGPPPGSAKRFTDLGNEVQGMAKGQIASKLDDNYLENYAKQLALKQAQQQQAGAQQPSFASGPARPVFGKR